jgi:IclR family transcriptional regulator, acetate operon repressor
MALDQVAPIELTRPLLRELASASGESASCAIRIEDAAVYVDQVPSDRVIRHMSWIGRRVPLFGTAIGAALRSELNGDGYSYTSETVEPDVTAIAAPVLGASGVVICAISVTGPSYRISAERILEIGALVADTATTLGATLGAITFPERFESLITAAGEIQTSG